MSLEFNFLMKLGSWQFAYEDAKTAFGHIAGRRDGVLLTDASEGVLSITCSGQGLRRDFAPEKAHGYTEYVKLNDELLLMLVSVTPTVAIHHRFRHDRTALMGVQLQPIEEINPIINSADKNLMFLGVLDGKGRSERVMHENRGFLAVSLARGYPLPANGRIGDVHVPTVKSMLDEGIQEIETKSSFFFHHTSGGDLRQCAYEMLHTKFQGELRFDFLRAKSNELLCFMEDRAAKLDEKQTSPSYRLSQVDRERLEQVRQYIANNPAEKLSINTLAANVDFSSNRLTTLFKLQYDQSVHQYVIVTRMRRARKLLESTDQPVKEIALSVGYRDVSGFGRAFKKIYGVNPTTLRHH